MRGKLRKGTEAKAKRTKTNARKETKATAKAARALATRDEGTDAEGEALAWARKETERKPNKGAEAIWPPAMCIESVLCHTHQDMRP